MKGAKNRLILSVIIFITTFICATLVCTSIISAQSVQNPVIGDNASSYIWLENTNDDEKILPSKMISFEILVHNIGDQEIIYYPPSIDSYQIPPGWMITFSPAGGLTIPANKYHRLFFNLTAADDANANTVLELEIVGTTSIPEAVIIPADVKVEVSQTFNSQISAPAKITFSSPNTQENLIIKVNNFGNGDERLSIEIMDIPAGLTLSAEAKEFIIGPGEEEFFTFTVFPSSILTAGNYELNITLHRITEDGLKKEWVSSQRLVVEIQYYPDLDISYEDIELSKYTPTQGDEVSINITLRNIGDSDARNFTVKITPRTKSGSNLDSISVVVQNLKYNETSILTIPWVAESPAVGTLQVQIDPENKINELDEENNEAKLHVFIIGNTPVEPPNSEAKLGDYSIYQVSAVAIIALISGITVTSVVSTEYGKYSLFKLILPFYTRVKKEEVLNHEVRELVYDYVQSHPGEHFRAILTKLGLTNGTLIHHLQTLERQNFIKSERDGPFKRFYPMGRNLTEDVLEINGFQMKILDAVKANPGITQKDLARMLDTSPPTINYHVKALHLGRLLNLERDGKNTRCFPGQSLNGWYQSGVA